MPATEQTARDQKLLHLLFAISGAALLLSTFWMLSDDHSRQWKAYQRDYIAMENRNGNWQEIALAGQVQETNDELTAQLWAAQATPPEAEQIERFKALVDDAKAAERVQSLYDKLVAAADAYSNTSKENADALADAFDDVLDAREALLSEMNDIVADAKFIEDTLLRERKFASADLDAVRSEVGIAVRDAKPTEELEARVAEQAEAVADLNLRYQAAAAKRKAMRAIVSKAEAGIGEIRKLIEKNEAELSRIEMAIADRTSEFFTGSFPYLGKRWLELPIADAFNSPRSIDNLWTANLTIDYNGTRVRRFDRCTTCHQGIDKPGGYVPEHDLIVSLATPEAPVAEAELTPELVYGMVLGDVSLTGDQEVTVHAVSAKTAAASAIVVDGTNDGKKLTPEELALRMSNPYDANDKESTPPGLLPGDVIIRIDGNEILSLPQAERLLTESVTWGEPVELTIRRGAPQPFTKHPRLDLFLSSLSPHPLSKFGCTSCHEGQGNATEFKWVSHTPDSLTDRTEWREDYGWFNNHHWIYPMFPARFAESGCVKCHHNVTELAASERFPEAPAPKLTRGHHLIQKYGCFGCHEINGYNGDERIGPDMRLEPNYYSAALALASDPNYDGLPEEIKSLAEEVGQHPERSTARRQLVDWLKRDIENEKPVLSADSKRLADVLSDVDKPGQLRKVGPSLRYAASKLDEAFLYDWLENPRDFRPSTRMPRFFGLNAHLMEHNEEGELVASEAMHTAESFQPIEILAISTYLLDRSQEYQLAEPVENIESGTEEEQIARGKILFETRGCLACHTHADFPDAAKFRPDEQVPAGPDLTGVGSKFDVSRNPHAAKWLYSWIENPSSYNPRTIMPDLKLAPIRHAQQSATDEAAPATTDPAEADPVPADPAAAAEADDEANAYYTDPIADIAAYLMSTKKENWSPEQAINGDLDDQHQNSLKELSLEYLEGAFYVEDAKTYYDRGITSKDIDLDSLRGAEVEMIAPDGGAMSDRQRLLYVGRKAIGKYGCYACHDIPGFEDAKPIGAALADWGRKDPSKLAFEHISQYLEHGHGEHGGDHGEAEGEGHRSDETHGEVDEHRAEEGEVNEGEHNNSPKHYEFAYEHGGENYDEYFHHQLEGHSRDGFIYQKLREPRSYDYHSAGGKGYNEWLRMPQFPFDHDEREAIITVVLGLVADPPAPEFVYAPDERELALIEGKQVLEKYNCAGCHMLSVEEWDIAYKPGAFELTPELPTFPFVEAHFSAEQIEQASEAATDEAGLLHAKLVGLPAIDKKFGLPMIEVDFDGFVEAMPIDQASDEDLYRAAEAYYRFQIWQALPIDGKVAEVGSSVSVQGEMITGRQAPYGGYLTRYLLPRVAMLEKQANPNANADEAYGWLPPPLIDQGNKTQGDWLFEFLLDPHQIRPAVFLQMPKFNMSPEESRKLVNYFAARDNASFPYESQQSQRADYLTRLEKAYRQSGTGDEEGDDSDSESSRLDDAMKIVINKNYCVTCHLVGDYSPTGSDRAKAPNLAEVHKRLRQDYVFPWIANPKRILPYTGMPVNIPYKPDAEHLGGIPQDIYHGTSVEQVRGLTDLLLNYDEYIKTKAKIGDMVKEAGAGEPETDASNPDAASADAPPADEATPPSTTVPENN